MYSPEHKHKEKVSFNQDSSIKHESHPAQFLNHCAAECLVFLFGNEPKLPNNFLFNNLKKQIVATVEKNLACQVAERIQGSDLYKYYCEYEEFRKNKNGDKKSPKTKLTQYLGIGEESSHDEIRNKYNEEFGNLHNGLKKYPQGNDFIYDNDIELIKAMARLKKSETGTFKKIKNFFKRNEYGDFKRLATDKNFAANHDEIRERRQTKQTSNIKSKPESTKAITLATRKMQPPITMAFSQTSYPRSPQKPGSGNT